MVDEPAPPTPVAAPAQAPPVAIPVQPVDPVTTAIQTSPTTDTENILLHLDWGSIITTLITSGIFGKILNLAVLIATETYEQKRIARQKNEAYEMSVQRFKEIVDKAMSTILSGVRKESGQAQSVEDQIDKDLKS